MDSCEENGWEIEIMLKILHSVSNMDRAGIETMLMNYYRHMDRDRIQFEFLANKPKPGDYDDEVRSMGGQVYVSPGLNPLHYPDYLRFVGGILQKDKSIKIVHAHNEAMGVYALNAAKKAGVGVRIAHAHNTRIIRDYKYPLKLFCKQFLPYSATDLWSCGRDAGIWFFGKKNWEKRGHILRNAISLDKFAFNESVRAEIRSAHGFGDKTVIGHVGRLNVQKNHTRLLDIFAEYVKINPHAVLALIGEGELEDRLRAKAAMLGIKDKVYFAGLQSNVNEWYQAFDVFVLPSLFEGLPVVGIEAQAAGLACLFSDAVTDEVVLSQGARRLSLKAPDSEWATEIDALARAGRRRSDGVQIARDAGYDIVTEAERLTKLYLAMSERQR